MLTSSVVVLLALSAFLPGVVHALPNGAPSGACVRIFPEGHRTDSQPLEDSPFSLNVSSFGGQYAPGETYRLTLSGSGDFRGLLVQARSIADNSPVGSFENISALTRLSSCNRADSAITHSSRVDKTSVELSFTAPPAGTGPFRFQYAVVDTFAVFYAPIMSDIIREAERPTRCRDGQVRLVDGNATSGRVELCYNNTWGTVCDDFWDVEDARVVCRQLGLPYLTPLALDFAEFNEGMGPILLDDLHCDGDEMSLLECPHIGIRNHNCGHHEDAGVICSNDITQCFYNNVTYAEGEGFPDIDGCNNCTCRSGSLRCTEVYCPAPCSEGTFPCDYETFRSCFPNRFRCDGFIDCDSDGSDELNCPPPISTTCVYNNVTYGEDEQFLEGDGCNNCTCRRGNVRCTEYFCPGTCEENEFRCIAGFFRPCAPRCDGREDCFDGSDEENCPTLAPADCYDGQVRLVDGNVTSGRVELCFNQTWGTVCDDDWDSADATVVCRQLGLSSHFPMALSFAHFGPGRGPIHLDDLGCNGNEVSLLECPHIGVGNHNCRHLEDAGVDCLESLISCEDEQVRLVGGGTGAEGRVELCYNNTWGTVCDDFWDVEDARVVCRQLGLPFQFPFARSFAHYGPGQGPIYLDDLDCSGHEISLLECPHIGVGNHNCGHLEDAGVYCSTEVPPPSFVCETGQIRLVNGSNTTEGRVEVCFNNTWGTVCDDTWGR
ncbi:Scavenger receptor cysteine-rich type 1 protein M160 [Geodia barretti]|uniref:Scavenger receptor cysteine-rich type 1 protein M160 n=1 Tax=Geodia barretti TaxID=519541 RepID=A0AA35R7V3_GEOBA|nr:Scavenger receptor cysteine-rich type 1 protein M160 [Geodia barretti]